MSRGRIVGHRTCVYCGKDFDVWQASLGQQACSKTCANKIRWDSGVYGEWMNIFLNHIELGPPPAHLPDLGPCWLWTGKIANNGYGIYSRRGGAHRVMWRLMFGDIPDGLFVLHYCDIKNCVNPEHLRLGTQSDNMKDMFEKGRHPFLKWASSKGWAGS